MAEIDKDGRYWAERYRLVSKRWVAADKAARILEETKTAVLSQMIQKEGDKPYAHAERDVKASPQWTEFVTKMVEAREDANRAKVEMEWVRMNFSAQMSVEASARAESRL